MKHELEIKLIKKYPRIFNQNQTLMPISLFGVDIEDGWFNLIDKLCEQIQDHINWSRKNRVKALQYNRAIAKYIFTSDQSALMKFYTNGNHVLIHQVEYDCINPQFKLVPNVVDQVIVTQIKEKFGTLRFYFIGGDAYIDGLIDMAEAVSGLICERCGNTASTLSINGWYRTVCDNCKCELDRKLNEYMSH